jgi:hypothetical protein
MVRCRQLFLARRGRDGRSLVVLHVRSFDFFDFGLTEVHDTSPDMQHLKGRQFQNLAQAANECHIALFGEHQSSGHSVWWREYDVYCIGLEAYCVGPKRLDPSRVGTESRTVVVRGKVFEQRFSPELAKDYVVTEPDDLSRIGFWVQCADLLPIVPVSTSDEAVAVRLAHEVRARP